jgi:hypothetical protein
VFLVFVDCGAKGRVNYFSDVRQEDQLFTTECLSFDLFVSNVGGPLGSNCLKGLMDSLILSLDELEEMVSVVGVLGPFGVLELVALLLIPPGKSLSEESLESSGSFSKNTVEGGLSVGKVVSELLKCNSDEFGHGRFSGNDVLFERSFCGVGGFVVVLSFLFRFDVEVLINIIDGVFESFLLANDHLLQFVG